MLAVAAVVFGLCFLRVLLFFELLGFVLVPDTFFSAVSGVDFFLAIRRGLPLSPCAFTLEGGTSWPFLFNCTMSSCATAWDAQAKQIAKARVIRRLRFIVSSSFSLRVNLICELEPFGSTLQKCAATVLLQVAGEKS